MPGRRLQKPGRIKRGRQDRFRRHAALCRLLPGTGLRLALRASGDRFGAHWQAARWMNAIEVGSGPGDFDR